MTECVCKYKDKLNELENEIKEVKGTVSLISSGLLRCYKELDKNDENTIGIITGRLRYYHEVENYYHKYKQYRRIMDKLFKQDLLENGNCI